MQRVVELTLKSPFELRVVEIAGVQNEIISVDGNGGILELDDDFDSFAFGTRREVKQGMLVKAQLEKDAIEARGGGFGHRKIVKQIASVTRETVKAMSGGRNSSSDRR
jgi:hypothetical protein